MKFEYIQYVTKPDIDERTQDVLLAIKHYGEKNNIRCFSASQQLPKDAKHLIISIGGDGTMLGAMRLALEYPLSYVFGINTGTLGFLSEEIKSIDRALTYIRHGNVQVEERMAIDGELFIDGESVLKDAVAINEFTMAGMTLQRPLTIGVDINHQTISEINGSGVLVATSTGSTAMALSGGGAIISPNTNVMQIVPVLPHTLTSRPIVTTGRDTITLTTNLHGAKNRVEIYGDGTFIGDSNDAKDKISLRIKSHENKVKIVRPSDWNFFHVLSEKMKW